MNMFTEIPREKQIRIVGEILGDALYQQIIEEHKTADSEDEILEES